MPNLLTKKASYKKLYDSNWNVVVVAAADGRIGDAEWL